MRKRRVGVTARSRQNDGNQETGTPQFATEMAAPLEIRTPAGTCGKSCNQSADGSLAKKAQQTTCRSQLREVRVGRGEFREGGRSGALRAHEALPHTPPGGKPPETPGPLSLETGLYGREEICQGFATPAKGAALDKFPPFREQQLRRGKGGLLGGRSQRLPLVGPKSGGNSNRETCT